MYCEHCGMLIGDPGEPCPACGQLQSIVETEFAPDRVSSRAALSQYDWNEQRQSASMTAEAVQEPVKTWAGRAILILGIVGLILAGSVYLSIPGVVVAAVALYRSAALKGTAEYEMQSVRCGTILGWIGLILGTLLTLAAVVFLVVISRFVVR